MPWEFVPRKTPKTDTDYIDGEIIFRCETLAGLYAEIDKFVREMDPYSLYIHPNPQDYRPGHLLSIYGLYLGGTHKARRWYLTMAYQKKHVEEDEHAWRRRRDEIQNHIKRGRR
jgi:hypothetical protein